jgi:hypothetical protein
MGLPWRHDYEGTCGGDVTGLVVCSLRALPCSAAVRLLGARGLFGRGGILPGLLNDRLKRFMLLRNCKGPVLTKDT